MVFVSYTHRLLIDEKFVRWLKDNPDKKSSVISKLLRININSKEHRKKNVLIYDKDFSKLCDEGIIKDKEMIRGALTPMCLSEMIPNNHDKLEPLPDDLKRLVIGVALTDEKPFNSILLTTKESKKGYMETMGDFLEKLKRFDIKDEEESLIIIENLYHIYTNERSMY